MDQIKSGGRYSVCGNDRGKLSSFFTLRLFVERSVMGLLFTVLVEGRARNEVSVRGIEDVPTTRLQCVFVADIFTPLSTRSLK